jgi:hypothetical protein
MIRCVVLIILLFFVSCQGSDNGKDMNVYEAFVAKVDGINVDDQIDVSDPVVIGISGRFEDDCSELARISNEKSSSPYDIELTVYGKKKLNVRCNRKDVVFVGSITITGLSVGRYRVRINNDDNLVKYFSIVQNQILDETNKNLPKQHQAEH